MIEIIMVISIITILSIVSFSWLSGTRERGRDDARVAHVKMLSQALAMYYGACAQYPNSLATGANNGCPTGTTLGTYIASIPTGPRGASYGYATSGAGSGYDAFVLRATLEQDEPDLGADIDGSTYKGASLDCSDSPTRYYCLGS